MPNDLILPKANSDLATRISDEILAGRLEPFVEKLPDRQAWYAAMIVEVNKLPENTLPGSVMKAALNIASLKLMPGETLGLVYLIPYTLDRGKPRERVVAQVIPGYRGYLDLAYSNKFLKRVHTEVVLKGEEFEQWNDENGAHFRHPVPFDRQPIDRNTVAGAYVVYETAMGGSGFEFVSRADLDEVDTQRNVWRSNYGEMCRKSPVRRAAKYWKITPALALAVELDEQADRGEQGVDEPYDPPKPEENYRRVMAAKLKSFGCQVQSDLDRFCQHCINVNYDEALQSIEAMKAVLRITGNYEAEGQSFGDLNL